MSNTIKVKASHADQTWIFERKLTTPQEIEQVKDLCKSNFWEFSAQFIPVRTHNLKDFCKDFFFPSVTLSAVKIDSYFMRLLEVIVDLFTLPIRILTAVPRVIYNALNPKEKDPLYLYLKTHGLSADLLKRDAVYVGFEWTENVDERPKQFVREISVGFIALPKFREFFPNYFGCKGLPVGNPP